jgi:MFS family permease
MRVLRYPDFRLLWIGAFLSFTGSWVQNVAQGYYVYNLTHNAVKLAFVSFAWNIPVLLFGLVAGSFSDRFNKRTVLIWTQVFFTCTALFLAVATYWGFVQYWQIVLVSFLNGLVSCIEMPTRQSIVSRVVPVEELAAAVPINSMTFNVARIAGPAIGALILDGIGVSACYFVNAISFFALVWAGWAIKSDLTPTDSESSTLSDLVFEGALYTFRDHRLRALFLLEAATACFGLAYIPLIPAYIQDVIKDPNPKAGNGHAYTAIGVGAIIGLIVVTHLADSPHKGSIVRFSMWTIGVGLILLSIVRVPIIVFAVLACIGMASMMQLNTTNALFQLLSPDRLRGRVLAMHIWALNGLSPFGVLFMGWVADQTRVLPVGSWLPLGGVPLAMECGGICMIVGGAAATLSRRGLSNLIPAKS